SLDDASRRDLTQLFGKEVAI
ncbi:MFS transporter, partial [Acinetobacter baumannii]